MFPVGFLDSIISKILTFSYTLLRVTKPFRKTTAVPLPLTNGNSKMRFYLKDTTITSTKTMDISSLLNTDLDNLNELKLDFIA